MKKLSMASLLSKKSTSRNERNARSEHVRACALRLESLESRELLSVAPGSEFLAADNANIRGFISGPFTVDEARAAYEANAATSDADVVDLAEVALGAAETAPDQTVTVDAPPTPDAGPSSLNIAVPSPAEGVSGPGEPSTFYDADKSDFNTNDDDLCWAATASNMLWHTGWASVTNAQNEQEFFDSYFVNAWPDAGGNAQTGISWFLTDKSYSGGSTSAYASAGYYSQLMGQYGESARDYVSVYSQSDSLQSLSASLTSGDAVGLSVDIYNSQGNGHAITCWGYAVNASYASTDPRYYAGLYITDSDDEKSGKNDDELNERILVYVGLEWRDNLQTSSSGENVGGYLLNNYNNRTGDDRYYLTGFQTLKQRPEKYASVLDVEPISTVVTTTDDVYDVLDGKISLREALVYAHPGDTITFADSLQGKTIKLDSERGELTIDKSITIDASSLLDATTSAPGLTISGEGATRILRLDWGVKDAEIKGITFANGFIEGDGGAIYNYGATLSLDNCVIRENNANYGGAIYSSYGKTTLTNCLVADNSAKYSGGAMYAYSTASRMGGATLVNCTVTNNGAERYGGGFYLGSNVTLNAHNSIVVGNVAEYSGDDVYLNADSAVANAFNSLSNFSNWTNGANNLTYNASKPLFTNATAGNYTLAGNSQAIDKGNDPFVTTTVDLAGRKRISGEKVDLGAYEYQFASDLVSLSTPANVAYAESDGSINVSWEAVQGASGYRIAYRTSDGPFTTVDVASNKTTHSLVGLTQGETYCVKVAALGDGVSRQTSYYSRETSIYVPTVIVVTSAENVVDANDGIVTLREAFNSSKDGDTITFASSLKGKTITLSSELSVIKSITIDASSLYNAVTNTPGITISGGDSMRIVWIHDKCSVVLKGLKFTGCRIGCGDGSILIQRGDLLVEDCVFSSINANHAKNGNAIVADSNATLVARSTTIAGNNCAGIRVEGKVSLMDCNIENNNGTGIHVNTVGEASLSNCNIVGNAGSGFTVRDNGGASLSKCNIINNDGYGILAQGVYVSATSCKISDNVQTGINLDVGEASLMSCEIDGNGSMGIFVSKNCVLTATNCLISRNSANYGAGLYLYYGNATLYNCTIVNNTVNYGGGVYLSGTVVLNAYNTIIANNSATYSGGDVYIPSNSGPIANAYNVLSSYANWTSGANNLTYDATQPLFTSAELGVYTLAEGSQAIDKGNNEYVSTTVDLAGKTRIAAGLVDLGAYEYQTDGPLAAPINPRVAAKTETTVTIAWDAVPNATGYKIAWRNKADSANSYVTLNASKTSYKLSGLDSAANYYWKVQALGDGVVFTDSAYTKAQSVAPRRKLDAPVVSADAAPTAITVSWNAVPGAARYYVSYKLASETEWSNNVNAGTNLSYTVTGLAPRTKYDVRVKAIGDNFDYSTSDFATTTATTPKPSPVALDVPTNLRETAKTETTVTVAWDAVPNATGYKIAWRDKTDSANAYITLGATATSYKLTGLDNGASYYWRVQALGDGVSYSSSAFAAARTVKPRRQSVAPTLSADSDPTSVTVSWSALPNVARYYVSYKLASATEWSNNVNVGTNLSHTITGLAPKTQYDVRVKAIGDNFEVTSSDCSTITVKTANPPANPTKLDAPANPRVAAKSAASITAAWDAVPDATGYRFIWKNQSDASYTVVTLAATKTSYKMTELDANATYVWKVLAVADNVYHLNSEYCATRRDKPQQTLDAPTVTVAAATTSLTVKWSAVANAVRYDVYYRAVGESTWTTVDAGAVRSFTVTGLESNKEYDVRLKAVGDGFNYRTSGFSTTVRAKTETAIIQLAAPSVTVDAAQTSLTVSWDAVPNADRYSVSYKLATESTWTNKNVGTNLSYTIAGLNADTEYDVRVKAVGDGVSYKSAYSAIVRAKTDAEPTPPVGPITLDAPTVTVAAAPTSLTVSWDAVPNADRYSVSYKLATESTWTNKNVGTNLSFAITGLEQNTEYDVRVKAIGDGTNYKSAYSATVRAQTTETTQLAAPVPSVTAKTATMIDAAWSAVPNATGYRFAWKNQSDASYSTVAINAATTSYQLTGLDNSATYIWKVLALGDGVSFLNSDYSATRNDKPQQTLAAPVLTVYVAPTSLTLNWSAVPNADRYSVAYKLESATTWSNVNAGTNCSYTITGLASNTLYNVRIKAIGDGIDYKSVYSSIVRAKTPSASSALFDDADGLFDELAEEDYDLLAENFVA